MIGFRRLEQRCPVKVCGRRTCFELPKEHAITRSLSVYWGFDGEPPFTIGCCLTCHSYWEVDSRSRREREKHVPCSSCAFKNGSPELRDAEQRKKLRECVADPFGKPFVCHVNIPLAIDPSAELERVRYDYAAAGLPPEEARTCGGFLRSLYARGRSDRIRGEQTILSKIDSNSCVECSILDGADASASPIPNPKCTSPLGCRCVVVKESERESKEIEAG